jgi:hypothetical protein
MQQDTYLTQLSFLQQPMLFLSSYFALPVVEFPNGSDGSASALPLDWVSKFICKCNPSFSL